MAAYLIVDYFTKSIILLNCKKKDYRIKKKFVKKYSKVSINYIIQKFVSINSCLYKIQQTFLKKNIFEDYFQHRLDMQL